MKKLLILALAFVVPCLAVDIDISTQSLTISDSDSYVVTGTTTINTITVTSGSPTITLDDCSINVADTAFAITGGSVTLVLSGDNALTSGGGPGLRVATSASLTVSSASTGTLEARGGSSAAGIGGKNGESSGAIVINGGSITAYGANYASGIGGGAHGVANLTINDGTVTAQAGYCSAAIGGGTGYGGHAGSITINGGYVYAFASNASGIGCGDEGGHNTYPAGTVTINGGTVYAKATLGAGIGAGNGYGDSGRGPNIHITGGSIYAISEQGLPLGPGRGNGECPDPINPTTGEVIYCATLPNAAATAWQISDTSGSDYTYTAESDSVPPLEYSYSGRGHEGISDLFFYLPNGDYVVSGSDAAENRRYTGTIADGEATFTAVPEPCLALLALLGAALLGRRK